eukprot:SAG31_NODE_5085_length_2753_cov_2.660512_3_plen_47_part_00
MSQSDTFIERQLPTIVVKPGHFPFKPPNISYTLWLYISGISSKPYT